MALHAVVDNLDNVDAQYHDLYTEKDGKFYFTEVIGLKPQADFDRVHSGLTKERNDHKETKGKLNAFAALGNADEVLAKLDRIPELELAASGKLDEPAIEKLVTTRLATRLAPVERERDQLKTQLAEKDAVIVGFQGKERTRTITETLREAAKKVGLLDTAFEDAALLGERVFEISEDGRVTAKEGMGCTPGVEPSVWLTEMQTKRPHWWGPSQGGGATGSGQKGGGTNPWSAEGWNMTEQGRIYNESSARAEQMAKSAGTTIGGKRPAAKK